MTDTAVSESKAASAHASWGALVLDDSKPASQEFLANLPGVSGIPIYKVLKQVHPELALNRPCRTKIYRFGPLLGASKLS